MAVWKRSGPVLWPSLALIFLLASCSRGAPEVQHASEPGGAHPSTAVRQAHAAAARGVDLADPKNFADAKRGLIAAPHGQVKDADGKVVWDFDAFAFVDGAAPPSVNPSLWRMARLNNIAGLFKVADGIWQLRGFDLANITIIEGKSGWILVDALTARETAQAALAFARQHLGDKPISGIVFTHSHVDHFGGALGVLDARDAAARKVPIVAPAGFLEEASSENVLLGIAMSRRAMYMYGNLLPRSPQGAVDTGLGKAVAVGKVGILPPTLIIDQPTQEATIDGVRFVFHNVPGTEAPAELTFSLPDKAAYCGAELMNHTLHNLYTLRGAKVRDAQRWSRFLDEARGHAANAEVVFNQHHWPVWGKAEIQRYIALQRDLYAYLHDQTVRMINAGLTGPEIAEQMQLPKVMQDELNLRGYYGTVRHNVRAIYQAYMGWFDAHPANLDALPPLEEARRYVQLAGGPERMLAQARAAYAAGDLRWAAELLKHLVYAEPKNSAARELQAQTFEQLGYMAESAPWRNFYLSGAYELRNGPPKAGLPRAALLDLLAQAPIERFLEAMAASLNGARADGVDMTLNLAFSDLGENYVLHIENAVMHIARAPAAADAQATLTLTKPLFLRMLVGEAGAKDLLLSKEAKIGGSAIELARFFRLFDKATGTFPIVEC